MKNLKLVVAYQGTHYLGWQKTRMGPSIEETLEKALEQIVQHSVQLQAASRTDAGVHAEGQVVNFFTPSEVPLARLQKSLNGLLPGDISVLEMREMEQGFHPTLHTTGKEYHYWVCLGESQLPFHRHFSWHFTYSIDLKKIEKACPVLIGKHDFSAFTNEREEDNVREVTSLAIASHGNRVQIRVAGNNFLYKMVRNIVGTLMYIGCDKIALEDLPHILASCDRTRAGMTAPAHGLSLKKVLYAAEK
jgi:tRNA pseudouridine38-40 synthase